MATAQDVANKREEALNVAGQQFDRMDPSLKGFVTRDDILAMRQAQAAQMNVEFSDTEVDSFMADFDSNGDGKVSRQEFINKFGTMFDQMVASRSAEQKSEQ